MNNTTRLRKAEIESKLIKATVDRAAILSVFFAISFVAFGFTGHEILHQVNPSITLWANVWPRILLNGLPFLLIYYFFKKNDKYPVLKLWCWSLGFPLIFSSACLIHIWPEILAGHHELYLYVHAANGLVLVMALAMVAPPPRYLVATILATVVLFVLPLSLMFFHLDRIALLKFFLNDMIYAYVLGGISAHTNFKLRKKLAIEDSVRKWKIEKFVGNLVSESIFENNEALVQPRTSQAFLMMIDVRGFTGYVRNHEVRETSLFKEKYHQLVSQVVGEMGGFIHKTSGDGHLLSLGLMNPDVDLSDVPGLQQELETVEFKKRQQKLERAITIFERIFTKFQKLKQEMFIDRDICVCASIDFGEVGLKLLGAPNVRLEFDVEGLVVIRCTRLESFTKILRKRLGPDSSFLVISSTAAKFLAPDINFKNFLTQDDPIRDFPDELNITYREYKSQKINGVGAA